MRVDCWSSFMLDGLWRPLRNVELKADPLSTIAHEFFRKHSANSPPDPAISTSRFSPSSPQLKFCSLSRLFFLLTDGIHGVWRGRKCWRMTLCLCQWDWRCAASENLGHNKRREFGPAPGMSDESEAGGPNSVLETQKLRINRAADGGAVWRSPARRGSRDFTTSVSQAQGEAGQG